MKRDVEIAELKEEIRQLRQQNQWLLEQLKLARSRRFGASSEKQMQVEGGQMGLFQEEKTAAKTAVENNAYSEVGSYRRRKAGQIGVARLPGDLPVEIVEHELPFEESRCCACGGVLHTMGREVRDELKLVPARAVILRHIRHSYGCRHCEKHNDHVPVVKADMPKPVIKGSFASPETIAHIAYEKYVMGSPLYRQEQDWRRKGIPLSRQVMSGWLLRATESWLVLIYEAMRSQLLAREVLHADETTIQVLHEPGRRTQSKSYLWEYRTGSYAKNGIVLYEYQESRKAGHPKAFLENYRGYLHTDGYEGYHDLPGDIIVVGCWAHVRRRFHEAAKVIPASARMNSPPMEGLRQIGALYKLEEEYRKLPAEENHKARLTERQKRSKPLVQAFFEWCNAQNALPRSHFGQALSYALNQRVYLERYLLDGRLEIDNNRAERSIKPVVIGRKNWLFCNTPAGARASAVLYSVMETAKENGLHPFEYLTYVFRIAPDLDLKENPDAVEGSVKCLLLQ